MADKKDKTKEIKGRGKEEGPGKDSAGKGQGLRTCRKEGSEIGRTGGTGEGADAPA